MTDTDDVVDIAHGKFQELVGKDRACVGEAKQRMISKDCSKAHGPGVHNSLMTEAAETAMSMYDLDLLADENIAKDWEAGEHSRHGCFPEYDQERDMVYFEPIRKIANASPTFVRVRDNDGLMSAVDQFRCDLIEVAFDSSWLREEVVADHGDVVRHLGVALTYMVCCNVRSRFNRQSICVGSVVSRWLETRGAG